MAIDESSNGKARGIQLVQVEGFLEVARRGSVSRAAEALFVTQPTLTARLHSLERELGAAPAVSTYILPGLLEQFVAAHPRVEVSVRTGHSEDVVDLVQVADRVVAHGRRW